MAEVVAHAQITRIADVTRLDRIGLPCWQAIRPMGRSLSVHQGKALTDEGARLGAVLEAWEAHCGEHYDAPVLTCGFEALSPSVRAPAIGDFAKDDAIAIDPSRQIDWVVAPDWRGREVAVPFACISMDFTRMLGTPIDRSSNGVAVGSSRDEAIASAMLELIERDAVTEWKSTSMIDRIGDQIDLDRAGLEWLDFWRERLQSVGASLRCYTLPSLTGTPVIAAELGDSGKSAAPFRAIHGHSAHPDPEVALFRAIAETIQGRAAYIAGSRDDLPPSQYALRQDALRVAFAMPLPVGMDGKSFDAISHGPASVNEMVDRIAAAGLGPVVVIDLGQVGPFHAVRVIACGLAARRRRRRVAA